MATKPRVAIIGRPNVGKSTLFNRFSTHKRALTSPVAGTTRDRNESDCYWTGKVFTVVDTGGFDVRSREPLVREISKQAQRAMESSRLVLFVVSAKEGIMTADREIAQYLRAHAHTPVILIANKADSAKDADLVSEFYTLGFDKPWPVSAISGRGTGDVLDEIVQRIQPVRPDDTKTITIALIGKPNVGKSSLINALVGEERVIVHPEPYTTRDTIGIPFTLDHQSFMVMDTAGVRRKSKIGRGSVEYQSVRQSLEAIEHADVTLLVTDASAPLSAQDRQLARLIAEAGASVIMIGNKWDLIRDKSPSKTNEYRTYYYRSFNLLRWAPLIFLSALHKTNMGKLKETVMTVYQEKFRHITENALNKFLKSLLKQYKPTRGKGTAHPYIYRIKQAGVNPPQFAVQIKDQTSLKYSYVHIIERELRAKFGFTGAPIKLWVEKIRKKI